jgi:uncharacterized membrane protein HdeD (DUF308 family)
MVDTNWRAVLIGIATVFVLTFVSTAVQELALLGGFVASIAGGAAAGYYANSGRTNGAWNGFLSGAIGGLALTAVLVVLGLAVSIVELSLGGVFATIGVGIAALVFIVIAAIPATVGGYLGGMMARDRGVEAGQPAA